jgi:amino acid transporter
LAASIGVSVSRLSDVNDKRLWVVMAAVVLAVWLVGAAITKYSLEQMAYYTPIAVVVLGATVGLVLLWVKIVLDSLRRRREQA